MNKEENMEDHLVASELQGLANRIFFSSSPLHFPIDEMRNADGTTSSPQLENMFPEAFRKINTSADGSQAKQPFFPVKYANELAEAMPSPTLLRKRASETKRNMESNLDHIIHKLPKAQIPTCNTSALSLNTGDLIVSYDGNLKAFNTIPDLTAHSEHARTNPQFYFLTERDFSESTFSERIKNTVQFTENHFLEANAIKRDFPILGEIVNGKSLVWLDNAATTQKPKSVIDRLSYYYSHENSNIHRAAHELAARSTDAYEGARKTVQTFINAGLSSEIIFVRGTTEGINLVAKTWGENNLHEGDEIILSHLEHHANIVPWQQLAAKKKIKIKIMPVDESGQILLTEYGKLLTSKTKLVSFTQVSNALGTITPAKQIINMAHHVGAKALVDGAQSVAHMQTDVLDLNADWFVFSGHKLFGPTGIGVLYGKEEILDVMSPWQGGGGMIKDVTFEYTQYQKAPMRFEAGTGNIADAVGLGAAIDYISKIGINAINQYEHELLAYATNHLSNVPGLRLIGTASNKASVLSFVLDGFRTEQVSSALNKDGIAVRAGHHCAQPILRHFGLEATVRASLAFYNTYQDIDRLVNILNQLKGKG